ncbi:hypothetical protein [Paraburkholderia diazotrophica]|uniref:hypothetical protein n=1 Tax=Paraburkholderia diazotrophica TaxID=667676 RepID=UPI00317A2356
MNVADRGDLIERLREKLRVNLRMNLRGTIDRYANRQAFRLASARAGVPAFLKSIRCSLKRIGPKTNIKTSTRLLS